MPSLGADMERGRLVDWLVKPGDYVHRGDLIATVDTDKTLMDVESFEDGVIAELLIDVGATVPVGTPMARITPTPAADTAAGKTLPAATAVPAAPARKPAPERPASITPPVRSLAHRLGVDPARIHGTGKDGAVTRSDVERAAAAQEPRDEAPPSVAGRIRSSPRARRIAAELGLDLATVPGTGPQGAVTETDVRHAAEAPGPVEAAEAPAAPPPVETLPRTERPEAAQRMAGLRRTIGGLMSRSKRTIPHYYLSTTLDLRAALAWMQSVNAQRPVAARLVPSALLLKAAALAARDVPEVNGFYTDGNYAPSAAVHLGVAVALRQGGIVAPAIHDANELPLDLLMEQLRDLVSRARAGHLQRAEIADPTITVTNLGDLGVESVYGVIYPPQVAMIGLGRLVEQPWAQNGMVGVRPVVTATLSADHRVSDGLRGGRFLTRMGELLENPEEL